MASNKQLKAELAKKTKWVENNNKYLNVIIIIMKQFAIIALLIAASSAIRFTDITPEEDQAQKESFA